MTGAALASAAAVTLPALRHGPAPTAAEADSEADTTSDTNADARPPSTGGDGWIAQLARIPHTAGPDRRDRELTALQRQVPGATLLDSDNWPSLPPGYWIVRAPGSFADGYEALDFCTDHGGGQCSGRYLSGSAADRGYLCEATPAPDPATCRRPGDRA
ncbi:hypothetical protein [Kitasatospora sp. Ki12]